MHLTESVCVLKEPGAALSIPGSLALRRQEQQPLAPKEGTFLHPALLGCRTITKLLTHTMTSGCFLRVLIDLLAAGCAFERSRVISAPW